MVIFIENLIYFGMNRLDFLGIIPDRGKMSDKLINANSQSGKTAAGSRTGDLIRFYTALVHLESATGGKRRLSRCDGRMNWPERGVYFFFENGESRNCSGNGPRVVRVGTHALTRGSRATLWNRLSQHRGPVTTGGGNHRGSVFRKLVGYGLMARHPEYAIRTWGKGDSAPPDVRAAESELERRVSRAIGEMPFLWLEVDDPAGPRSFRGYIERNTISLLSNFNRPPVNPPSDDWLGLHCPRNKVQCSGLWNQEHVEDNYDPGFFTEFENLVARQIEQTGRSRESKVESL